MKKILAAALISVLTLVISSGCKDSAPKAPQANDAKISQDALYTGMHNNKKIMHIIEKAGDKTGWKITEFKSNEVLAEKTEEEYTVASSVTFHEGYLEFSNTSDTSDLRDAIQEEMKKTKSSH